MRYQLSFCEIEQLSDNTFKVTTAKGTVIDNKCAKKANNFWLNLRKKPFSILAPPLPFIYIIKTYVFRIAEKVYR